MPKKPLTLPLRALACFTTGAVMVGAMPPWNIWLLSILCFSIYYRLLLPVRGHRAAFVCGWSFGFGFFGAGLWWIANALLVPGNDFKWVWPFTIAGLPALLAFFTAFATILAVKFGDRAKPSGYLIFCAAFGLSEWLRSWVLSGFPWNSYGYTWAGWLAVAQVAALGGTFFLSWLTVLWSALPGLLWVWPGPVKIKTHMALAAIALLILSAIWGQARLAHYPTRYNPDVAVRPVQANISQAEKWDPEKTGDNLARTLALSEPPVGQIEAPTTLLLWPETALEFDVLANEQARAMIRRTLSHYHHEVFLLTGLLRTNGKHYYNSFAVLDRDLNIRAAYDKSHLVPFGEYIPLQNILPMKAFVKFDSLTPGTGPTTLHIGDVPPFSPLVCYEVIFPGAVTDHHGARPQWLANITNDAWYGDSPGPRQHFAQTRFRAIEEGLPMVRSAETGVSGVIDPVGRVLYMADVGAVAAQTLQLPSPLPHGTPYTRWHNCLLFAGLILSAAGAWALRRYSV